MSCPLKVVGLLLAVHPPILPVSRSGVKVECVRVGLWASSVEWRTQTDTFVTPAMCLQRVKTNLLGCKVNVSLHKQERGRGGVGRLAWALLVALFKLLAVSMYLMTTYHKHLLFFWGVVVYSSMMQADV